MVKWRHQPWFCFLAAKMQLYKSFTIRPSLNHIWANFIFSSFKKKDLTEYSPVPICHRAVCCGRQWPLVSWLGSNSSVGMLPGSLTPCQLPPPRHCTMENFRVPASNVRSWNRQFLWSFWTFLARYWLVLKFEIILLTYSILIHM